MVLRDFQQVTINVEQGPWRNIHSLLYQGLNTSTLHDPKYPRSCCTSRRGPASPRLFGCSDRPRRNEHAFEKICMCHLLSEATRIHFCTDRSNVSRLSKLTDGSVARQREQDPLKFPPGGRLFLFGEVRELEHGSLEPACSVAVERCKTLQQAVSCLINFVIPLMKKNLERNSGVRKTSALT